MTASAVLVSAYPSIAAVHASVGAIALATFWTAAIARKGTTFHRRIGQAYLLAMTGILATGVPLALGKWLEQAPESLRQQVFEQCCTHPSDTVRSWAAFAQAFLSRSLPAEDALLAQFRFARDEHFGVREWAWIALRPRLAQHLEAALALLGRHTGDADPLVRRFCIEILRPRGVWCEHIAALKQQPEVAEPLLVPLLAEAEKYAQDSVANWLNDASKTRADWVLQLFQRHPPACKASQRIQTRATRSLPQ